MVEEVGPAVTHLAVGDRVGIGWQRSACMACADCARGDENLCDENLGVITDGDGGFADRITMDGRFCFKLPDGLDTDAAGPLLCGGITVYSALRHAGMRSGQTVGVIGVGGLGHLAVQFASKMGNRVVVFTTSADKAHLAAKLGAHDAVLVADGAKPEYARPIDVLINTVPMNFDWHAYLGMLGSDGTLTFVGVPNEPMELPIYLLLGKRRRVTASPIGGRGIMMEMLRVADEHGIAPIVEKFPLARANDAIAKVRDNTIRYRAVLIP
ncbi:MAG: NAD(P)-dependent alcohol dehydrogenase [Deltaproteobacteria bacterium]|nr:NAD(P)-dependent alcohol dehydrogenase [Deltaproteobacteria bacterium]